MIFAQIKNNTIMNTIDLEDITLVPLFKAGFDSVIQIDNLMPQPGIGWTFDNVNWDAPPAPVTNQAAIDIYTTLIQNAVTFGQALMVQFAAQNVMAGITQAGQTQAVLNYSDDLYKYLSTGSLYVAMSEIQTMIADTSDAKASLAPFITNDILYAYLNQIQGYLQIPLTPNPGQ